MLFGSEQTVETLHGACLSRRVRRRVERMRLFGMVGTLALVGAILYWGPAIHGALR